MKAMDMLVAADFLDESGFDGVAAYLRKRAEVEGLAESLEADRQIEAAHRHSFRGDYVVIASDGRQLITRMPLVRQYKHRNRHVGYAPLSTDPAKDLYETEILRGMPQEVFNAIQEAVAGHGWTIARADIVDAGKEATERLARMGR